MGFCKGFYRILLLYLSHLQLPRRAQTVDTNNYGVLLFDSTKSREQHNNNNQFIKDYRNSKFKIIIFDD